MSSFKRLPTILLGLICLTPISSLAAESGTGPSTLAVGETLEDFFTAAIDFSPRLRIAEENMNIGGAREQQARGQLLPQVNANAGVSDNRQRAPDFFGNPSLTEFDGERYSVTLSQALFDWQAWSAKKRASHIENQLESQFFYELALLLADVSDRYLSVLQAQDALISVASEMDAVANQLAQIQSLFDVQQAQITDLRQAEASLAAVEANQLKLQAELAIAQESLRTITGIEVGDIYVLDPEISLPDAENNIQYWVQMARENNQQIKASRYALDAAEEFIAESKGASMPRVTLIAQRQNSNLGFQNALIDETETTYVGVDISIPIFSGGTNRARISEARSQQNIAENELRQIELEANAQVRSAYLQVQSSKLLTEAAERLVESTQISSEAMQRGFELGTVTNVDVLNALRDQYQAERDLQSARYSHIKFLLLLKREAGVLSADDILEVSSWLVDPETQSN